jgi:hypothetical protein
LSFSIFSFLFYLVSLLIFISNLSSPSSLSHRHHLSSEPAALSWMLPSASRPRLSLDSPPRHGLNTAFRLTSPPFLAWAPTPPSASPPHVRSNPALGLVFSTAQAYNIILRPNADEWHCSSSTARSGQPQSLPSPRRGQFRSGTTDASMERREATIFSFAPHLCLPSTGFVGLHTWSQSVSTRLVGGEVKLHVKSLVKRNQTRP